MNRLRLVIGGTLVVVGFLASSSAQAQNKQNKPTHTLAGTYRCDAIQVEGHKKPCTSPPLILNSDGSYQLWNEQGTYMVLDKYVVLSESRKRGPGLLKKDTEIIFEYIQQNCKVTVHFKHVDTPPPGGAFS